MLAAPHWKLDDDREHVTVAFPTRPQVVFRLDAAAIDDLIANLGRCRALMQPKVKASYVLGQKGEALKDPAWATEPDIMLGNSVLHLRDPRFGWLHYLFTRPKAERLGRLLLKQAATPPETAPPGKAN